jgi:membrane-bound serine protease (ClpP class)
MRLAIRIIYISLFLLSFILLIPHSIAGAPSNSIIVLEIDGTIVPVVADYIDRGIEEAEAEGSTACIIVLDTPGGLLASTEDIVQKIMNASVPVIVYVAPHGSWAASAGTFITISAHIAAMAPGTTIGAAHPVSVGESMPEDVSKKTTEYSAAWIRSIAEKRGRNPDEVELAVRESKSFTVSEAIDNNLVDIEAVDIDDLIARIDGRRVLLADDREVIIDTADSSITYLGMNNVEKFLHSISDPNIAYILLSLATIGLFTEIANPGLIFPGVAGGICLLISLYSLGALNAYWAGVLLILLAFGLFIAELFTPTFGILTAGGITAMVVGSLILFANNPPALQVNPTLIIIAVILISVFIILMIWAVIRGQKRKTETGIEGLIGRTAIVKIHLNPKGMVLVEGELWSAVIEDGSAKVGEEVLVKEVDGLRLIVTKK